MNSKQKILAGLRAESPLSGKQLTRQLGISRQALNVHLKTLMASGEVVKTGSTKNSLYYSASVASDTGFAVSEFSRQLNLRATDEGKVYELLAATLHLKSELKASVESIMHYAFTEILNNAIDHAQTERGKINVAIDQGTINFTVRDFGIGIFESIASKYHLADEHAAMLELSKGKTTTMPEAHSGEGIFFTSKIADKLSIHSHRISIVWDNIKDDVYVSARRNLKGTLVEFTIKRTARRVLEKIFEEYASADYDYQFQKTKITVKLLQTEYISRSEAKRLMNNLHKFREVTLDFKGVKSIGQGFADEVLRVFKDRHPDILIHTINTNETVNSMLLHVKR
ncbi:MAG: STAS-like domain-containing protein [Gammaproteobacteria bacterium]